MLCVRQRAGELGIDGMYESIQPCVCGSFPAVSFVFSNTNTVNCERSRIANTEACKYSVKGELNSSSKAKGNEATISNPQYHAAKVSLYNRSQLQVFAEKTLF